MSKNYLIYPCKTMNITQTYYDGYTHSQHNTGNPKDYPWDEAGAGSDRDYMYCPCDEMMVMRIYGVGGAGANTIWLQSTSKVDFADGTKDYVTILVTHPNDSDLKKLAEGQKFTRGQPICQEGTDGNATGNHFHFSAGKGKFKGRGWVCNSYRKWVLTTTKTNGKPENLFYLDTSFTAVKKSKGLTFKEKPAEVTSKGFAAGNYKVRADVLNVRKGPGTNYGKVAFSEMTADAKRKIKSISGKEVDGYVKGMTFTALQVRGSWGKTPSGWVHLGYCEKL